MDRVGPDDIVVGPDAVGMSFGDDLIANSDTDAVLLDRRQRPAGHEKRRLPVRPPPLSAASLRRRPVS